MYWVFICSLRSELFWPPVDSSEFSQRRQMGDDSAAGRDAAVCPVFANCPAGVTPCIWLHKLVWRSRPHTHTNSPVKSTIVFLLSPLCLLHTAAQTLTHLIPAAACRPPLLPEQLISRGSICCTSVCQCLLKPALRVSFLLPWAKQNVFAALLHSCRVWVEA